MIFYVFIIRTNDGLPLSASTDFNHELNKRIKEYKKYVKIVAQKAPNIPEKSVLQLDDANIFMLTNLGISYLVLVEYKYPAVLAFSFLSELMKEFTNKYELSMINVAKRPYHFIEFDSYIYKMRQSYNNPESLTRRLNISKLSSELSQQPPYKMTIDLKVTRLGVGPQSQLEPLFWYGWIAMLLNSIVALLGIVRGLSALHISSMEVYGGTSPWYGIFYLLEAIFRVYQTYLLVYRTRFRMLKSWIVTSILMLFIFILWHLRNPFQHGVFLLATVTTLFCTMSRKRQEKLPNQEV